MSDRPSVWMWKDDTAHPTFGMHNRIVKIVREYFDIIFFDDIAKQPDLGVKVKGAFTVVIHHKFLLEQKHLMPNLKIMANMGTGYNHLDVEGLAKEGILCTNTPDMQSVAVADMTLLLMLASARNLYQVVKDMKDGGPMNFNNLSLDVSGATLGLIGVGSIGSLVAKRAKAFDMTIFYNKRNKLSPEEEKSLGLTQFYPKLQDMLPQCDFLVLVCPLSEETANLIGEKELKLMKPTSIIVNVSRGEVIDQDALLRSLQRGEIWGAALDVTTPEPLPSDHPLFSLDNVLITPHAATATRKTRDGMAKACVDNLKAVLLDKTEPPNLLKPQAIKSK